MAFAVKTGAVKRANRLKRNRLYAGESLKIPVAGWERIRYRVRRGDHLAGIAKRYRTSVSSLKVFNGLRNSRIYVGEELLVYRRVR